MIMAAILIVVAFVSGAIGWLISNSVVQSQEKIIFQQDDELHEAETLISDLRVSLDRKGRELSGKETDIHNKDERLDLLCRRHSALRIELNSAIAKVDNVRQDGTKALEAFTEQFSGIISRNSNTLSQRLEQAFAANGIEDEDFSHASH